MKMFVGLVLLVFGSSLFLALFFRGTSTDTVIDVSLVLEPGEKYETYHHTRVISKSTLAGEIVVEDEGINFTAYGYRTQHLKNVFVNQNYSFTVDPANDLYTFKFENSKSNVQSSIKFTLEETWLNFFMLIPAFIGLLILVPAGLVLVIKDMGAHLISAQLFPFVYYLGCAV